VSVLRLAAAEDTKMYSNASDHTISSNLQRMSDSPRYQVELQLVLTANTQISYHMLG